MRLLTISKMLALGAAATWAYKHRRRPSESGASDADLAPDPNDPVQQMADDQFDTSDLQVDAMDVADAEAAQDLATLESDLDEAALELDTPSQTTLDAVDEAQHDTGELYGMHTPRAVDRELPDDRSAMDNGQNWLEALQESAVEFGAEPEDEIDPIDDQDTGPRHPSDTRDRPVADRGSGGPGGV